MLRLLIRSAIFTGLICVLLVLSSVTLGMALPPPRMGTGWSPGTYSRPTYYTRIDMRTGISGQIAVPSVPRTTRFPLHIPTGSTCQLAYAERERNVALQVHTFNVLDESWHQVELPLEPTFRFQALQLEGLWSPDANWLYVRHNDQRFVLDIRDEQGYDVSSALWSTFWSPDSRYFAGTLFSEPRSIHVFDTATRTTTNYEVNVLRRMAWSPDSRYLAAIAHTNNNTAFSLILLEPATGQIHVLIDEMAWIVTEVGPNDDDTILTWSPDSRRMAIAGQQVRDATINGLAVWTFIVDVETGTLERISEEGVMWPGNWRPTWSPDGRYLTYLEPPQEESPYPAMVIYDTVQGETLPLPALELFTSAHLSQQWSPDSRYLTVIDNRYNLLMIDTEDLSIHAIGRFVNEILGWDAASTEFAFITDVYNPNGITQVHVTRPGNGSVRTETHYVEYDTTRNISICADETANVAVARSAQ